MHRHIWVFSSTSFMLSSCLHSRFVLSLHFAYRLQLGVLPGHVAITALPGYIEYSIYTSHTYPLGLASVLSYQFRG